MSILRDGSGGYFIRHARHAQPLAARHTLTAPCTTSAPHTAPASVLIEFHDWFAPPERAVYRAVAVSRRQLMVRGLIVDSR